MFDEDSNCIEIFCDFYEYHGLLFETNRLPVGMFFQNFPDHEEFVMSLFTKQWLLIFGFTMYSILARMYGNFQT